MSQNEPDDGERLSLQRRLTIVGIVLLAVVALGVGWFLLSGAQTTNPYDVGAGATYNASDGPEIALDEPLANTTVGQPFPSEHRVDFYTGTWVYSEGPTEATLSGLDDSWTTASNLDVSANELTFEIDGKQTTNVSGGATHLEFRDVTLDDGADDLRIDAESTATVTLHDVPADTTIVAWGPDSGDRLDYATSSSGGVVALEFGAASGTTDVRLREANAPSFDDSTADPTGDQSEYPDHFTVDVDHEDFPETAVTVEFYLDGESIGTDTLTSAGEANVSAPSQIDGGSHEWHAVATDDYGNTVNSSTDSSATFYSFNVPDELEIRDEENPSELVTDANATLEFYFGSDQDSIYERPADDGTVDMTGLPTDQSFVVVADADGYHPRRIYVRSLFESEQVYLLNESAEFVDVTFQLEDFTGDYPEDVTVLQVQRNIGGDWQTVQGDFFGATGQWTGQLSYNTRHRLILLNTETGQERRVGSFTPVSSGEQTIRVLDSDTEIVEGGVQVSVEPATRTLPATNTSVGVDVRANAEEIDEWRVSITYENGSTTQTLYDETMQGPSGGSVSPALNLTDMDGGDVIVDVTVLTADGETRQQRVTFRVDEYYDHEGSLFGVAGSAPDVLGIGDGALTFLAVMIVLLITAGVGHVLPASTEFVGATALLISAVFAILEWLPWTLVIALAITYGALFAIWRGL